MSGHFLHSKEGVTQGDPLAMIAYGIRVLHLIRELWGAHPQVTQSWYADDAGAGGKLQQILEQFQDLKARGPARGYYPELIKSILVVAPGNAARTEEHFPGLGIRVVTGHRYLGDTRGQRGGRELIGGKDKRVYRVCGYPCWGRPKAPAV